MCICFFSIGDANTPHRFLLGGNRDEFFDRESRAMEGRWPELPLVIAGKDLVRGGTWLGVSKGKNGSFKFAVVHNYRHHGPTLVNGESRGELTLDFLKSDASADEYSAQIANKAANYNGFTLILVDDRDAYFVSNRPIHRKKLHPGVYALSNACLDTPWPKLLAGKSMFQDMVKSVSLNKLDPKAFAKAMIRKVLKNNKKFEENLPGILDKQREFSLSSIFIDPYQWDTSGLYGTRTHSVVVLSKDGELLFREETLDTKTNQWIVNEVVEKGFRSKL